MVSWVGGDRASLSIRKGKCDGDDSDNDRQWPLHQDARGHEQRMELHPIVRCRDSGCRVGNGGGLMFTFTFTDKELSIIEAALEEYMEGDGRHSVFSPYDIAELSAKITERLAW